MRTRPNHRWPLVKPEGVILYPGNIGYRASETLNRHEPDSCCVYRGGWPAPKAWADRAKGPARTNSGEQPGEFAMVRYRLQPVDDVGFGANPDRSHQVEPPRSDGAPPPDPAAAPAVPV